MIRAALIAVGAAALVSGAVLAADDPVDMLELADRQAKAASGALSRHGLGMTAVPNYDTAQFRNVRAHYRRSDMFKDLVIFCGEIDVKGPKGERTGWTKFGYWPGDPTTFFTETGVIGMAQIGPQVYKAHCASGQEKWLSIDFTQEFRRKPPANIASNG